MANVDGNTWYQLTEQRVDFNSSLQYNGLGLFFALANANAGQYWQFYQLDGGNYQIRNKNSGVKTQLGTCYVPKEAAPSKTQPCMVPASDDLSQQWILGNWDDGSYRIQNAGNGTAYNMDVHPGNPLFMSSVTAKLPKQPAQHWEFQSIGVVEDGAYSTSVGPTTTATSTSASATNSSTSSSTPEVSLTSSAAHSGSTAPATAIPSSNAAPSSQNQSNHHGLQTGAAVGIGIGIGLSVCALFALLLFLRRRRKIGYAAELPGGYGAAERMNSDATGKNFATGTIQEAPGPAPHHEMYVPPAELPSDGSYTTYSHPSLSLSPIQGTEK